MTSTVENATVVFAYDPENRTRVWERRLPIRDTHDVDMLSEDELVAANMREYEDGVSGDRVFVYNLTTDEITWEWRVHRPFDNDTAGGFDTDWTHVNDVDPVGDDLLVSLRNFDQVVLVDRETKAIEAPLGRDGHHDTLHEQHNPDVLDREPLTIVVADSENDRVVEYERRDGNTLVTDTLNHRVIEVTPEGEVVWEFYAPWAPYDAERRRTGPGSRGPTMAALNETGTVVVDGTAGDGPAGARTPADAIASLGDGTPVDGATNHAARRWVHVTPWLRPVWLSRWAFAAFTFGTVLAAGWAGGELLIRRRTVAWYAGEGWRRLRRGD